MYTYTYDRRTLTFVTYPGLFSPEHPDRGTLAMLSSVEFTPDMKVLDLGCGCGLAGLCAAVSCGAERVWMCDIDPRAVECSKENADRNGLDGVHVIVSDAYAALDTSGFDLILSNPPYQSDFSVAKTFIEKGFNRLKLGGRLFMVTKRRAWYENKLRAVFGGVKVAEIDGYFVFEAQRRTQRYAQKPKRGGQTRPREPKPIQGAKLP